MRLALAVAMALLAVPATASASTVAVVLADSCAGDVACEKYGGGTPVPVTTFAGDPGEANAVTVAQDADEFVIADTGAPLSAKAPCRNVDAGTARCPVTRGEPAIRGLSLALGDGDDSAAVAGTTVETTFSGGPGDDQLTGGGENDQMDGGPGNDRMSGGGGFDELVYSSRTAPVIVDLASGGGEDGEADALSSFETLLGGSAADVLRGTGRADVIDGGAGPDVISGRSGDDDLFGNTGADRLSGGRGEDRLFGDPAQGDGIYTPVIKLRADRLSGGPGDDGLFDTGGRNVYIGGPGRDTLEGGAGRDTMRAGPGNDRIRARRGGRDRVDCGAGRDRARTDRRDTRRHCER
jgi:Ca2+-binding RTX toxin-like protein